VKGVGPSFAAMDTVRFGLSVRALRRRRGWRQVDLAWHAGVSRTAISRVERGRADRLTIRMLRTLADALGARLDCRLLWNGEALDRLLDESHAALVETVVRWLTSLGWEVATEVSFSIRGERGSIDLLAFHPATATLLVVEVKSVVPDVQATFVTLDRKTRLASEIARGRGWRPARLGRLLVVREDRTARRWVSAHGATFAGAFPAHGWAVRRWLQDPAGGGRGEIPAGRPATFGDRTPFSGLLFLPGTPQAGARHRVSARLPGVVVGPRVSRVQETSAPSARPVR
jgi:transcriptional regulator with XRE-family HTH domain